MKRLQKLILLNLAVLLMAGCVAPAHAADRVYLRSGSDLICDHQENLNGQVRLYLTASDDNYLDVAMDDVVGREPVQIDPVAANAEVRPGASSAPVPAPVDLLTLLHQAGAEHHLDPDLLASVVRAESGGHARVVSRTGARGLMQLMPGTAAQLGVRDSFAPEQNVAGGTTYLDALLMYYHDDLALALAAYNAGPAAVARYHGIPPYAETRRYIECVIHDYNQRKRREARQHVQSILPASSMAAMVSRP
jgi:soluble lytic murein transglycosylase-like protein